MFLCSYVKLRDKLWIGDKKEGRLACASLPFGLLWEIVIR